MRKMRFFPILVALIVLSVISSILLWTNPLDVVKAFLDKEVIFAILLSLVTASISTIIALFIAIPTSYGLLEEFRGRRVVESVIMLPLSMPPVALGAALLIFFSNTPLGSFLDSIVGIVFNVPGLIVAQTFVILPLIVKALKPAFKMVDEEVVNVARTLGCDKLCLLRRIYLPLSKHALKSSSILAFTRAMGEFGASVTLAGAIRFKTETMPIAIYLTISSGEFAKASALIAVASLVAFLVIYTGEKVD